MKKIFLYLFFVFLWSGCQKEFLNPCDEFSSSFKKLEANFSFKTEGQTVTFTNKSVNAQSFLWDFGNGQTSTQENPFHNYSSIGKFKVKLTAVRCNGERSIIAEKEIEINCPTIANFSVEYLGNRTIKFVNQSQNATSFQWNLGDGSPLITNQSPTYTFPIGKNTFIVKLTSSGNCSNSITKTISVASGFYWLNLTKAANEEIRDIKAHGQNIFFTGGSNTSMIVGKLENSGIPDAIFNTNGSGIIYPNSSDFGQALEIDSQGRIIILGNTNGSPSNGGSTIWRLLNSGQQDFSFSSGTVRNNDGNTFIARDILLQTDNKVLINGRLTENGWIYHGIARLKTNGEIDPAFATNGWFKTTKIPNEYNRYGGMYMVYPNSWTK